MSANVIDATGGAFGDDAPAAISNNGVNIQQKVGFDELMEMHGLDPMTGGVKEDEKRALEQAKEEITKEKELDSRTESAIGKENQLLNEAAKEADKEIKKEQEELKEAVNEEQGLIKAKVGESEITVPEHATFTTKINGKDVEFQLKDAIDSYSYQETFERNAKARVGKITQMEQKLTQEVTGIRQRLDTIADAAAQGDMMGAIKLIAEMQQKDPIELEKEILDNLNRVFDAYTKMTPDQREAYFARRQADYLKEKLTKEQKSVQLQKSQQQLEQEVGQVCEKLSLSKEEFFGVFSIIAQNEVGDNKQFASIEEITPIDVAAYVLQKAHYVRVDDAIKQVAPDRIKDAAFRNYVIEMTAGDPAFSSADDIAQLIQAALNVPSPAVQTLSQKVLKNPVLKNQVQASSSKAKTNDDSELDEFFLQNRKR